ncbi:MAG: hypothetical protein AB7E49_09345 [Campylobacterales bacterium]
MVIILPAEDIRQHVDRILQDQTLDSEEKFEALSALHALDPKEAEAAIAASGRGSLTVACHSSLFTPAQLYS